MFIKVSQYSPLFINSRLTMTKQRPIVQHNQDGPLDRDFEKLVEDTLELWHVPGVSVAVVDGHNTWTKVLYFPRFSISFSHPPGLRDRHLPINTRDSINTLLRRKHDKSIHSSHHVIPSRRQRKVPPSSMGYTDQSTNSRRLRFRRRLRY